MSVSVGEAIIVWCKKHPRYKGIRGPSSGCQHCMLLWDLEQNRREREKLLELCLDRLEVG